MTLTVKGYQYRATNATYGGYFEYVAGTSIANPLEAGVVATMDFSQIASGGSSFGYLNPTVYTTGNLEYQGALPTGDTSLRDGVSGQNYLYSRFAAMTW